MPMLFSSQCLLFFVRRDVPGNSNNEFIDTTVRHSAFSVQLFDIQCKIGMKKLEIKEIDIWSVVRVAFFIFIVIGLIMGLLSFIVSIGFKMVVNALVRDTMMAFVSEAFTVAAGLITSFIVAVLYAVLGTFCTFIIAFFYNLLARLLGGITFDVAEVEEGAGQPSVEGMDSGRFQSPG